MDTNSDSVVHRTSMINDENLSYGELTQKNRHRLFPHLHGKKNPTPSPSLPRNCTSLEEFTEMKFETRTQQKTVICPLFHKCKEWNRCTFAILSRYSEVQLAMDTNSNSAVRRTSMINDENVILRRTHTKRIAIVCSPTLKEKEHRPPHPPCLEIAPRWKNLRK
ncbi:hypothetical protein CEXT_766981 [Caerostris extrusa]|uniref:Uncharacterized protein n=1 Tax=Caerostris extrusa TaxID=172846 RepID=A0AAV4S3J3_CAEEX|nr:hypothetical protein CEXT_766981 [Caerostris extrusa]